MFDLSPQHSLVEKDSQGNLPSLQIDESCKKWIVVYRVKYDIEAGRTLCIATEAEATLPAPLTLVWIPGAAR